MRRVEVVERGDTLVDQLVDLVHAVSSGALAVKRAHDGPLDEGTQQDAHRIRDRRERPFIAVAVEVLFLGPTLVDLSDVSLVSHPGVDGDGPFHGEWDVCVCFLTQ